MYRTNPSRGVSPRDRIDPRLLERLALRSEMPSDVGEGCGCGRMAHRENNCGCGNNMSRREPQHEHNNCGCNENTTHHEEHDDCGCENYNAEFDYTLAMVYSPVQQWQNLYCEEDGFMSGTIFRELDKPFYGPKCRGGNTYE